MLQDRADALSRDERFVDAGVMLMGRQVIRALLTLERRDPEQSEA